jgi:methylthioribose-1-phosphate isomerase
MFFSHVCCRLLAEIENLQEIDVRTNKAMGMYGANHILQHKQGPVKILTHCNTGTLATAGFGTALGII